MITARDAHDVPDAQDAHDVPDAQDAPDAQDVLNAPTGHPLAEFAGLTRSLEIGIAIAPTAASCVAAAKSLAAFLDGSPDVPVRLAGVEAAGGRVLLTLAVTLGTIDDVKAAAPQARVAVLLLQRIVDEFSAYDPSFTRLPDEASAAARLAEQLVAPGSTTGLESVVRVLAHAR